MAPILPWLLDQERLEKLNSLPDNVMVHDLSKGIPFGSDSVDVVYHSHLLEHLDRDAAVEFLIEARRVIKPGGIHRIVVPDLERACRGLIEHLATCEVDPAESQNHDVYVATVLEQSVRREATGSSRQRPLRRLIENLLLGDARRRGETHQWMYDRVNLKEKLLNVGYREVLVQDYNTSLVPNWADYGLDIDAAGNQYKAGSLYLEALK